MAADIDAVLSRLRERPECRDAVEVIERLTAERDRLREACFEASKRLYGSLARHRDLDLDLVSYRHLLEASTILNVALDADELEARRHADKLGYGEVVFWPFGAEAQEVLP